MTDAERILQAAQTIPFAMMGGAKTQVVMDIFGRLGNELGYQVRCHRSRFADASDHEWMYDMTWLRTDGTYLLGIPMVLESEFQITTSQGNDLDKDFCKLVQARADLRVWISTAPSSRLHLDNCKRQIKDFAGTMSGDQYVFAVYDWEEQRPTIEKYIVP